MTRGMTEPTVDELLTEARDIAVTDIGRARALVQQARVLARAGGDRAGEAEALYRIAELSYATGLSNEAFAIALEARDLAHEVGAPLTAVSALNLIAAVQYHAANYSEALASAIGALELYRSTGERASEGMLLNSLAVIQHSLRDTDRALVTYEAALMANKGQDRPDLDAITLANMAKVRAERGEDLLAVSLGESALTLAIDHAPEFVPEILARLSIAYVALSAHDRATSALDRADEVLHDRETRKQALSPGSSITVRIARGDLHEAQGLRDDALRDWGEALTMAVEHDMTEVALDLRTKLAVLNKKMGRFDTALEHQEARYALNEQIFDRGTDLRIKTLQIQHDTETARQQAEILRLRTSELEQLVEARTDEIEAHVVDAFLRMAMMAETFNADVSEHPTRVGDLVGSIATEMGEDEVFVMRVALAARLHDVGKVAIPESVLLKPGRLDPDEVSLMRSHTTRGAEILSGAQSPIMRLACEVALTHHERWNGDGYPRGLRGADIPLAGRIVAVADVYDSLVTERVYQPASTPLEAVNHVVRASGTEFDPHVVEAFIRVMIRREPSLATLIEHPPT
jgi:putative two-component system response regulator